mgnify:FL=1
MSTNKNLILLFFFHSSIALLLGQRGAQDTWYLDREVELPKELPGFRTPFGITIDSKGNSYVVDRDNNTITIWDQQGDFIKRIGGSGVNQGQFRSPLDIAITEEEIYIVDKDNHRIQVLDLNGTFLREWGSHGSDNDKFNQPYSIALGMNGTIVNEVYIADRYNYKAKVFDANGTFLRTIGENIISESTGLSIGPDGLLYLSSCRSNKIEVFETNGTRVRSFSTSQNPFHIDFFGDKLAVAMGDNHKIEIFDKNGTSLSSFGSHGTNPNVFDQFYHPYGLTYDPSGNLHIADSHNNRIQVFDANNSYLRSYGIYGQAVGVSPYGFQITSENNFLLTDTEYHRVLEIDENGTFLQMIATYGSGDGQVVNPRSAFLGVDNRIYVADTNNHRIQIFDRNGGFIRKFGVHGSADGEFSSPYSVLLSSNHEIFVADANNHRIQVFDTNGTFLRKFGSYGTLEGQIRTVHDIAFSDQGNVMVADWDNRRIIHFTPAGEFIRHYVTNEHPMFVGNLPHGLTAISRDSRIEIYDENGILLKRWLKTGGGSSAFDSYPDGTIAWLDYNLDKINFYKPTYRTVRPPLSKEVPLPEVISVVQPDNTNHLEITYRINDTDSSHVNAKMLGFIDGGNDLSQVIVPKTFVGAIAGKLDDNVSTNQTHTVTWNVGADWSVGFGELEVAILAKDDRDLLNIHFLTLPANSTNSAELQISRSPLTDTDLLNVWYWLLATGDSGIEHSIELSAITKPLAESNSTSLFNPQSISSLLLWLDANDTQSITHSDNIISQWSDKSGNDRHALFESGSPKINSTGGPSGMPYIEFRRDNGEDYLKVSGDPFMAKHMFYVFRSPHEKWNNYGGVLGHQSGRPSNYLFEHSNYTFHSNRNPFAVSINGMDLYSSDGFNMKPLTNFMILEIVVDNADESPKTNYKVGRNDGYSMDFDVVEILAFNQELSAQREDVLNYLSQKTNIPIVGLALAKESTTTGVGRGYLFDKMNLREATLEERTRAREGAISGAVNQFTPSFKVGPDERPNKVNEYGFDTGSTNGYWVTPK